jgi:hypothetical protein
MLLRFVSSCTYVLLCLHCQLLRVRFCLHSFLDTVFGELGGPGGGRSWGAVHVKANNEGNFKARTSNC